MKHSIDMLNDDIKKVLITLAWPIVLSNLIQTALGLVDMIWIGKLGSYAVTAIGTAGFYINFAQALSTLIITGTGVLIAQKLGEANIKDSQTFVKNGVFLSIGLSVIFSVFTYIYAEPLISFFKIDDPLIFQTSVDYLRHSLFGVPFLFLVATYVTILTSYGNTRLTFRANAIGLFVNIVLDPIFIFGLGPIPKMGVIGAAWATNIARIIIFILLYKNSQEELDGSYQQTIDWKKIKEVIVMGIPVASQRFIFIGISMIMARIVVEFGTDAMAAQRIGIQIESISYVTIGGLQGAIAAFIGQNYGNKNMKRVKEGYDVSLRLVFIFGTIISLIFIIFPEPIFKVFIQEPDVVEHGIVYMQAIGYSQLFMCVEMLSVGAFNGLGKTQIPALVAIIFTAIRIPMAVALSKEMGIAGVWWSISISSILKGTILVVWYKYHLKKTMGPITHQNFA
ncbi:MATE family efflux transporter [Erysipelothrix urinaevulpis]|uniref:MATE family efflux transporter n=1 Tax=Erysipelothrix urinaevulpis TaxID=2683717 RepID=UPI00135A47AE|nr:MATE family efflux transporter [Erysipelothrix urinaevulpis]